MNYVPETLYSLIKKYNKKKEYIPPMLGLFYKLSQALCLLNV
jgi:hypothetical protein